MLEAVRLDGLVRLATELPGLPLVSVQMDTVYEAVPV